MDNVDKLFKWDLLQTKITERLDDLQVRIAMLKSIVEKQDDELAIRSMTAQLHRGEGEQIALTQMQNWMAGEVFPKPE